MEDDNKPKSRNEAFLNRHDDLQFDNVHWADNSAKRVIEVFPNEEVYTVASGITPSGIIHVGHFRELITSELVRRALEDKGNKTRFIYSWDSYDAFRKIPKTMSEEYTKYLRLPDAKVPDEFGCHKSFAHHFMETAEMSFAPFHFPIEYQYQHELQTSGIYAEGIKRYLNKIPEIKEIINKFRSDDRQLAADWLPVELYSEKTGKDDTTVTNYDGEYSFSYKCNETEFENTIDIRITPIVKLAWRLDWPMRWAHYGVNFEPGGKDHSTPGGSFDTSKDTIRLVSNVEPPVYTAYEFVRMKGFGGKISSSAGNGATVSDVLEIYTLELIMFIFAGTRPNAEFSISFDVDVIKMYEDFDKLERFYYGLFDEKNPKKAANMKRTYELSMVSDKNGNRAVQKELPIQPSFRHLTTVTQSCSFDMDKIIESFGDEIKNEFDRQRVIDRVTCVEHWLSKYAPEEMTFKINDVVSSDFIDNLTNHEKAAIKDVAKILMEFDDARELMSEFKLIIERHNLVTMDFFKLMYNLVISKDKGPKLALFMIENKNKMISLLNEIL
jgi:lysyl-tRNA synthetase class 1